MVEEQPSINITETHQPCPGWSATPYGPKSNRKARIQLNFLNWKTTYIYFKTKTWIGERLIYQLRLGRVVLVGSGWVRSGRLDHGQNLTHHVGSRKSSWGAISSIGAAGGDKLRHVFPGQESFVFFLFVFCFFVFVCLFLVLFASNIWKSYWSFDCGCSPLFF